VNSPYFFVMSRISIIRGPHVIIAGPLINLTIGEP
jgi:hypothetical protein